MNSRCWAALIFVGCAGSQKAPDRREELQSQAEEGDEQAQYQLAKTYCCGLGIGTSTRKSLYWHCRAAIQGYAPAQFEMGNILSNFFDDADRTTADVHARGLEPETIVERRSSLEDVFLRLTGRSLVD